MGAIQSGINQLLGMTAIAGMTPTGQRTAEIKKLKSDDKLLNQQMNAIYKDVREPNILHQRVQNLQENLGTIDDIRKKKLDIAQQLFSANPSSENLQRMKFLQRQQETTNLLRQRPRQSPSMEQNMNHFREIGRQQVEQRENLHNLFNQVNTGSGAAFTDEERANLLRSIGRM